MGNVDTSWLNIDINNVTELFKDTTLTPPFVNLIGCILHSRTLIGRQDVH